MALLYNAFYTVEIPADVIVSADDQTPMTEDLNPRFTTVLENMCAKESDSRRLAGESIGAIPGDVVEHLIYQNCMEATMTSACDHDNEKWMFARSRWAAIMAAIQVLSHETIKYSAGSMISRTLGDLSVSKQLLSPNNRNPILEVQTMLKDQLSKYDDAVFNCVYSPGTLDIKSLPATFIRSGNDYHKHLSGRSVDVTQETSSSNALRLNGRRKQHFFRRRG